MKLKHALLIGMASALTASVIYFLQQNKKSPHQKPPKGAPQLKLENPGSQDDFPKPPMESEVG